MNTKQRYKLMYRPHRKGLKLRISEQRPIVVESAIRRRKALHNALCSEFECFRRICVMFTTTMLLLLANELIEDSYSNAYGPAQVGHTSGKLIAAHGEKKTGGELHAGATHSRSFSNR